MCEVIEFKTRSELLSDWIREVSIEMDCSNKMFSLHFYYGKRKAKTVHLLVCTQDTTAILTILNGSKGASKSKVSEIK